MNEQTAAFRLSEQDQGRELEASAGQVIEIRLRENPTAGFRWQLVRLGEPVCLLLHHAFEPGDQSPGQPGTHFWRFKIVSEGMATIELDYRRSWETGVDAARVFGLRVRSGS